MVLTVRKMAQTKSSPMPGFYKDDSLRKLMDYIGNLKKNSPKYKGTLPNNYNPIKSLSLPTISMGCEYKINPVEKMYKTTPQKNVIYTPNSLYR